MNNPSVVSGMASTLFNSLPVDSTFILPVNCPVTPSLINYIPSSMGGSFHVDVKSSEEEVGDDEGAPKTNLDNGNERCQELWRAFKDAAGPWKSHRFDMDQWQIPVMVKDSSSSEVEPGESFDGILTKELIAPNLSKVDMCPEFQHYAYTKCVLPKKKISDITALKGYPYLQYVDISSNKITTLKPLGNLPFLKILDASHNLLRSILDFKPPFFLTVVNLSHNRIKTMRDLSDFWSITDLNLSHNMIRCIDGIKQLRYLTTLNLSFNWIEALENLGSLRIQFLFLQNNHIKLYDDDVKAEIHLLRNIRTINLNYNQVSSLRAFESVENLESLDIVNNNVSKLLDIYYLRGLKYLSKLNLIGNPVTGIRRYFEVCLTHIKNLTVLDGTIISSNTSLDKISNDITKEASNSRLKLLVLEQLNPPKIWNWLVPYDCPPVAVIVLVGCKGSNRTNISKRICANNGSVVMGISHTTKPRCVSEVEGDPYYFVSEETFMSMVKKGEFLTYQEEFGTYYGIAHSEFQKAKDKILMFYSNLSMALGLKRRCMNIVLILTLTSTREVHMKFLLESYMKESNNDICTMKIIDSVPTGQNGQQDFFSKKIIIESEAMEIVDELVNAVCHFAEEQDAVSDDDVSVSFDSIFNHPRKYMTMSSLKSQGDLVSLQAYWSSEKSRTLSMFIQPRFLSSSILIGSKTSSYLSEISDKSRINLGNIQRSRQIKKYVAASISQVTTAENTLSADKKDTVERDNKPFVKKPKVPSKTVTTNQERQVHENCPIICKEKAEQHVAYSEMLMNNEKLKMIFDEELRVREELIDLHLDTPGLFRDMIYTDYEEETMEKLKILVNDMNRFNETTKKSILNFDNDEKVSRIIKDKIEACFKELSKEVYISEKQADEFPQSDPRYLCQKEFCNNPSCPKW